jgi:hypothetical protein
MQKHLMDNQLARDKQAQDTNLAAYKARQEDDRQRDKQDQDYAVAAKKVELDAKTKVQVAKQTAAKRAPA